MATVNAGKITKGMYLIYKGEPHVAIGAEFMNPGKGSAIMRVKYRSVKTGAVYDFTYKTTDTVEVASVEKKEMQYLYHDNQSVVFMNPITFDQVSAPTSLMEDQINYLIPGTLCNVLLYEGNAIGVILPIHVKLKVTESPDAVAGDRVNAPRKLVTLETGLQIEVPLFIKAGDILTINTSTGEYVSRAN
jgi:elongation factor P